ncbi:MAG TPA: aryl-sulfate sulfotransferase [Candidatus Dormibacteraeota bacterium]|nr:aryl-sulfate sulfotransferase [Candidatus Dormibacteraeota bacterium]
MKSRLSALLTLLGLLLATNSARADYHAQGYMYLSPVPEAEYCPVQTRFVLVRFSNVLPSDVTNLLTSFLTVTGASSGNHAGSTHVAMDGRTVIYTMSNDFMANEIVTVTLNPGLRAGAGGTVLPYQFRFAISTHLPDAGTITARGDNPPNESRTNAFDNLSGTKWVDLVVPNGSVNFSWLQYLYPGSDSHVVNQYAITSAADFPERDPRNWNFYGVDQSTNLILLDTRTNQSFSSRSQKLTCTITNFTAYRGYRLEITRVQNPATATAVQLAELQLLEPSGTLLREVWLGIGGTAVTDLTGNANYPNNPSSSDQLPTFEAPINWADNYGTRIRGYITAPNTGSFVFWISSDDAGELWLSTNSLPANKQLIASVPGWTNPREWNKYGQQKSAAISLVAGQKYYIEALQKEGGGGDSVAVGWAKPGQATATPNEVVPGSVVSTWPGGPSMLAVWPASSTQINSPLTESPSTGSAPGSKSDAPVPLLTTKPTTLPRGVSVPTGFPLITVTTSNNPDPEYIFIDNRGGNGTPYNVIFDNSGSPVWYQLMPDERRDMKVQHNGIMTLLARDKGQYFYGMNTNYQKIVEYASTNGYSVDEHELQVLADGTYFLIGLSSQMVDMSRYVVGGNPSASVTEDVVQGFTPAGELIFQWRSWDHFDIRDQGVFIDLTSSGFDFPHMNSIDADTDGNILLSSRSLSELTKINRDTGEIIWRLGGARNQFTFPNDSLNGPRNQHAFRMVATNRYTLFDNGNLHSPSVSRGVEYLLNLTNMAATIMWQYPAIPTTSLYSFYMGNVERLPNGNTLINWAVGNLPKITEVRPDGTKAYEMNWTDGFEAYRVWRCAWQGMALKPNLIIEPYSDKLTLIFNKFGDTNVAYYRIYGGTTAHPTNMLATTPQTIANLQTLQNQTQYYFRVTAVSTAGAESDFSDEQSVFVNIIRPGQNMVINGDFSQGTNLWIWTNSGTANSTWSIVNGAGYMHPISAGTALSDIQVRQAGFKLVQGSQYVLEFDAWANATRSMEVRLALNQPPFTAYKIVSPSLTPAVQHFSYPFVMTNATDLNARLAFNLGASTRDVYLDNIAVWMVAPGDFNRDRHIGFSDLSTFVNQWLQQGSGLTSDLDTNATVDFKDFKMLGDNWAGGN